MNLVSIPKLTELVSDPGRVKDLPTEAIPAMRGELVRLDSLLLARLLQHSNGSGGPEAGDRLLSTQEAAEKLGTSTDYLYRHSSKLPFTVRMGALAQYFKRGGTQ